MMITTTTTTTTTTTLKDKPLPKLPPTLLLNLSLINPFHHHQQQPSPPPVATLDIESSYRTASKFPLALLISLHAPNSDIRKNALLSLSHIIPTWASSCYTSKPPLLTLNNPLVPASESLPTTPSPFTPLSSTNNSFALTTPSTPLSSTAATNSQPIFRSRSTGSFSSSSKSSLFFRSRSKSMGQQHLSNLDFIPPSSSSSSSSSSNDGYIAMAKSSFSLDDSISEDQSILNANRAMLHLHLSTMVRLALTCPYADVRLPLQQILQSLHTQFINLHLPVPIHPSPSYFIALPLLPPLPLTTDHETTILMQNNHFGYGSVTDVRLALEYIVNKSTCGRLPNYARVLAYFPKFLLKEYQTYHHLISVMPGPLPPTWRLFIGILAAAQLKNMATAALLRTDFLHIGGDIHWVTPNIGGLSNTYSSCVPKKLSALAPLNALLALQPWRLDPKLHFAPLILEFGWSVGELVHAIVILATVHSQCAVAFGTGIVPDVDTPGGAVYPIDSPLSLNGLQDAIPSHSLLLNDHYSNPNVVAMPFNLPNTGGLDTPSPHPSKYSHEFEPYVSANENNLTHLLISRLHEALNGSSTLDDHSHCSTKEIGGQRRSLFDRCEGSESISDCESDQDLVPPHSDHTFLCSIPPPLIPHVCSESVENLPPSISEWWTKPGTVATIDARDLSAMQSMYTASSSACHGITAHVDFDVKSPEYSVFRLTDFCWEDHGIELVSQYLGHEMGEYLDLEFNEARQMTMSSLCPPLSNTDDDETDSRNSSDSEMHMTTTLTTSSSRANKEIDTTPFREAIWYYVLRIFGQSMDDFNYAVVNHLLNKRTKAFIKKVATAPHTVTYQDWMRMGLLLRPDEKAHIVVLVAQARKQAVLVWALSALTKYLDLGRRC